VLVLVLTPLVSHPGAGRCGDGAGQVEEFETPGADAGAGIDAQACTDTIHH